MSGGSPPVTGAYGKMPGRGDFIRLNLPLGFVEPWDAWLQAGLAASREQLGGVWLERYLNGPFWRFAVTPGAAGPAAVAGVMMPSVDAANRHFPLTIARVLSEADGDPFAVFRSAVAWFGAAEALALSCLDERVGTAELEAGLGGLPWPAVDRLPVATPLPDHRGERLHWRLDPDRPDPADPALASQLLHGLCRDRFGGYALFWTSGSDAVEPELSIGAGLPLPGSFAALFEGGS